MCWLTRSGTQLYYAHATKTERVKDILRLRGLRTRLGELRQRRPIYQKPPPSVNFPPTLPIEVQWPSNIRMVTECLNPEGVQFKDAVDFSRCSWTGDCFMDLCANVDGALYCTPDTCNLDGIRSNAPRTLATSKLFDTDRVGLGVFTSTDLTAGDVISEYAGVLNASDPIDAGQPGQRMKHNTGCTMLLNARSTRRQYIYVESINWGSTVRFISHSSSVKVLVRMTKNLYAGSQITVDYGNQTWFRCACDECWTGADGSEDDESS
ncbi:hypothetical protein F442_15152 [Phytophthora nicotianae P10297]|uniref:SET domain-containing protein n=1 Tax=Phytophthora nicotianae P10297 TaxID=1317064 RepID=W2YQ87_PHYNI|nr:hypothetical protein F442_15152 [Phytophthora nicotianae P10297]